MKKTHDLLYVLSHVGAVPFQDVVFPDRVHVLGTVPLASRYPTEQE